MSGLSAEQRARFAEGGFLVVPGFASAPSCDALIERARALVDALADIDNFRKRVYREMDDERKYQSVPILKSLLPVFDGLDRAVFAASQSKNFADLLNGVQMTIKQLETALAGHGAKTILAEGQPFDPNLHEAISQAPSTDHPPMTVLHDVERGYTLHDRVIRPSKVIVTIAPPKT